MKKISIVLANFYVVLTKCQGIIHERFFLYPNVFNPYNNTKREGLLLLPFFSSRETKSQKWLSLVYDSSASKLQSQDDLELGSWVPYSNSVLSDNAYIAYIKTYSYVINISLIFLLLRGHIPDLC